MTETPPRYRTYEERRAAQEKIRRELNQRTHREYRLPVPKPPPLPDTGGKPTRDMPPVQLKLRKREEGEVADVISLHDRRRPK